jgi:transposase-like protein
MANKKNNKLKNLIKEYGIKDLNAVHNFVKMLTAETIQTALDAELDEERGYSKYDYKNKNTKNSRNGYSTILAQSSNGEMELKIPRDRDGDFEPQLVKTDIELSTMFKYSPEIRKLIYS